MGNYIMQVDFFGNKVRCETDGLLVCLNDLVTAGNMHRAENQRPLKRLQDMTTTDGFNTFLGVVSKRSGMSPKDLLFVAGRGRGARTMAHYVIAIYIAEQMSPEFHYEVIKTFMEGKLLEFRELGGTEFKTLNAAIDRYLPNRECKDNKGVFIQIAKLLRTKILGKDAEAGDWNDCPTAQTHMRYEAEKQLIKFLEMGLVRDYEHLKELVERL